MDLLTIGEFSRITGLTVKALRFYHESGLLEPRLIDPETGYRYYVAANVERANAISVLKEMGFTLGEIKEALTHSSGEEDLRVFIERKITQTEGEIRRLSERLSILETAKVIGAEPDHTNPSQGVVERERAARFILLKDLHGPYNLMGKGFRTLWRAAGRYAVGPAFALYHSVGYEEEAEFSAGLQLRRPVEKPGFRCVEEAAGKELALIHKGPYGSQGPGYEALFERARREGILIEPPLEERFLKGPGLIFGRNPQEYLTELVLRVPSGSTDVKD